MIYLYFKVMKFLVFLKLVEKVDDNMVKFMLNKLDVIFFLSLGMDFIFIYLVEYVDVMLKVGKFEIVDIMLIGIGLFVFIGYVLD